jgi:hypothetical protein
MNISQMQFAFVAEQDRLLFRVHGGNGEEVRAWITRRLVRVLWPTLVRTLSQNLQLANPSLTAAARPMMLEMKREAHLHQADFATPYREEAHSYPLGTEPFVVARVSLTALPNRCTRVSLHPQQGQGIDINMPENMLHAFCETLQQAAQQAEWELKLGFTLPAAVKSQSASPTLN